MLHQDLPKWHKGGKHYKPDILMGRNNISSDVEEGLDTLETQYVTLDSGETYDAVPKDEMNNYEEAVVGY